MLLEITGGVNKTMVLAGGSIRLTGGCNGKGRMSVGWSRGDLTGPDWA